MQSNTQSQQAELRSAGQPRAAVPTQAHGKKASADISRWPSS